MTLDVSSPRTFGIHHVVGNGAEACVRDAGYPVPEAALTAHPHDNGFIARIARDEFLVADERPWQPPQSTPPWCFRRSDHVIRLTGDEWPTVLAALCPHNLRNIGRDTWLMATVAGVDVWLYSPDGATGGVLIGCEPSFGHYLRSTLQEVAGETVTA